ncbi:MAG TPA: ABC transporter permease [Thermoanaerobaculia bacterium]
MSQELRRAARNLVRHRGFALAVVLCLALGLAATSANFSVAYGVLLRALPYHEPRRLVVVWNHFGDQEPAQRALSEPELADLAAEGDGFESVAGMMGWRFTLTGTGEPEQIVGARASADLFRALGRGAEVGRTFLAHEDGPGSEPVAVLSHGFWQRRFGGERQIVGRTIVLNGQAHTVVGVMPPGFRILGNYEIWTPMVLDPEHMMPRSARAVQVFARLRPGIELGEAQARLDALAGRWREREPDHYPADGWRLTARPLLEEIVGTARPAILARLAAGLAVLVLACGNTAQLLLARAARREVETAVRAALGASRWFLGRPALAEATLLALAGGVVGVFLARAAVRLLRFLSPAGLPRLDAVAVDGPVIVFTFFLAFLSALAVGSLPTWRSPHERLARLLKEGGRGAGAAAGGRFLIVVEVALALVVLTSAGLLARSFWRLEGADPGFRRQGVLTAQLSLPRSSYPEGALTTDFFDRLLERAAALPGIRAAGAVSQLPLTGGSFSGTIEIEGQPPPAGQQGPTVGWRMATPDYFRAMDVPVVDGRPFDGRDHAEAPAVVIVDEGMAKRFWPGRSAVGQRLALGDWADTGPLTVVGVVGQVRQEGLDQVPLEQLYLPLAQMPRRSMAVVLRAEGDPAELAAPLRRLVTELDAGLPVSAVATIEELLASSLSGFRTNASLFGLLAAVAVVLAAVGVHGVTALSAARRTREFGVRLALGGSRRDVVLLVLRRSLGLALAGVGLGLLAAFWVTRILAAMLYGVEPFDPPTFTAAALFLVAVTLLAGLRPAWRASRTDPIAALRHE